MSYDRRKLLRALAAQGMVVLREGASHTIIGKEGGVRTSLPRHAQIDRHTTRAIVKQLALDWKQFERNL